MNEQLIDSAIGKLLAHMDPDIRVTDIFTTEEHREMKRRFASVREHHKELHRMTPRVPAEAEVAVEIVDRHLRGGGR